MKVNLSYIRLNGFNEIYRDVNSRSLCGEGLNARGVHVSRTFTLNGDYIIEVEKPCDRECAFRKVSKSSLSALVNLVPDGSELVVDI
jgi:hypothetical protein